MKRLSIVHGLGVALMTVLVCTTSLSQFSVWQKRLSGYGESVGINPLNPHTIYAQNDFGYLVVSRNQGKTWSTVSTGVPYQIREIIVHPKDTLTLFIVDFLNGLWRSTNGGASWTIVIWPYGIDGESVTYDPVHPDTMYAGNFSDGALYKSTNRGASWTQMGTIGSNLCALAVRPDSANILLAGSGFGTISKSTNGGVTWRQVKSAGSSEIPKIVIDRTNPRIAYGTAFGGDPSVLGVWKTTNGGENWFRTALQDINVWALDIDQSAPGTLYAGTFDEYSAGVYKTTDGGTSWEFNGTGFLPFNSMWNIHIDPINTANIFLAATHGSFGNDGLYRLTNANAGVEGTVRDSLTNNVIQSGQVVMQPAGESQDLSTTYGRFALYRVNGDTVHTNTFSVYINSSLFKQDAISFINDSILQRDILVLMGSIRGNVFNDLNNNGARDAGEPGISNWTILLTGSAAGTIVTDLNGDYSFAGLFPGTYLVNAQARNGWTQTSPNPPTYVVNISAASRTITGKDVGNRRKHGIVAIDPVPYSGSSSSASAIHATFDTAMAEATFKDTSTFIVTGKRSGRHRGSFILDFAHQIVTFTPDNPFQGGEDVTVNITGGLMTAAGEHATPFSYVFSVGADAAPGTFVGHFDHRVGWVPFSIAVGDIDGDGDNDILTANYNGNSISVLNNTGGGGFTASVDYAAGAAPTSLVTVDLDRDDDLDVVTANSGNSTVSVLRNNGDGTFAAKVDYSLSFAPFSVDAADLDGDGYADLLAAAPSSSLVAVLINNHSGGFPIFENYIAGGSPWSIAAADLDGDGTFDGVSLSSGTPSSLHVLGNLGNGTFGPPVSYTVGTNARVHLITDVTGDDQPDLVTANSGSNSFSIYPKSGTTFGPRTDVSTGSSPWGIAAGDLDGDGLKDIVVTDVNVKMISVFKNQGGGSFARTDYDAGSSPRAVAIADLDGDGDLDVVVANTGTDSVSIYINSGATTASYVVGWNLISLPVLPADLQKSSLYPAAASSAFGYAGNYVAQEALTFGNGYWLKFPGAGSTLIRGDTVDLDTISVRSQWNMIGSISTKISTGAVTSLPAGIIRSNFYAYDGAYRVPDSLAPGKGFWVKTSQPGYLILSASSNEPAQKESNAADALNTCSTLEIRDASGNHQTLYFTSDPMFSRVLDRFELPPIPPGTQFDARFRSGRILERAGENDRTAFPIQLNGADYPVELSWNVRDERHAWSLGVDGHLRRLRGSGSLTLSPSAPLVLQATPVDITPVPQEYSLDQNFPNPFNPSTELRYGLPERSIVQLRIMNILGQEIARLVDGEQPAGFHAVTWRSDGGSGIYFYQLRAISKEDPQVVFSHLKKMILLK